MATACVLALAAGCGGDKSSSADTGRSATAATETTPAAEVQGPEPKVKPPKGPPPKTLVVKDLEIGSGPGAREGDELTTQFVSIFITGKPLESSWDPGGGPFSFELGANESSPGWERGLRGMKVGGRRQLIVPPELSSRFGVPPGTGPEETLVYVIELLAIDPPPSREGASGGPGRPKRSEPEVSVPSRPPPKNLVSRNLIEGNGAAAAKGDELTVEYVGVYYDGSPFTNSWERSKPFEFTLGGGESLINPGWEKGIPGMRAGGRRELIVPPKLLYRGGPLPGSKPSDTLVYVIDLVAIN